MPMPKASIDEDAGTQTDKSDVGCAGKCLCVDAIAKAMTEEKTTNEHFWSSVFRLDSTHTIAALLGSHLVCHGESVDRGGKLLTLPEKEDII